MACLDEKTSGELAGRTDSRPHALRDLRLLHYSKKPLESVKSTPHFAKGDDLVGYKTPGLWVSVQGEYDWEWWCKAEDFRLESLACITEVVLASNANIKLLQGEADLDSFTAIFSHSNYLGLDWRGIRENYQGLIIAPYVWERRLSRHTYWYYCWDCASGVIWDAKAVAALRPIVR